MVTLKRSKKVQSIIFPLYRGNGHFGHLGRYPNSQENVFWTFWTSDPGTLTRQSIHEVYRQTNYSPFSTPLSLCSASSTTHAVASSSVLIGRYPAGLRPVVLVAVINPIA